MNHQIDYNHNLFERVTVLDDQTKAQMIEKGQSRLIFDTPPALIKPLLRFINNAKGPFTLLQLKAYFGIDQEDYWFINLLDEAVRFGLIEYSTDKEYFKATIKTSLYLYIFFDVKNSLSERSILDVIEKAEARSDKLVEKVKRNILLDFEMTPSNSQLEFLTEYREQLWRYYKDKSNPISFYDINDINYLINFLSTKKSLAIPDTFFTNNPNKFIKPLLLNAILNKLTLRKSIVFATNMINQLRQFHSSGVADMLTVNKETNELEVLRKPESQSRLSYQWLHGAQDLQQLYASMNGRLIVHTEEADFIAVFSGKPINTINPIKWHDNNVSELLYLITRMLAYNLIKSDSKTFDYAKLKDCFYLTDGNSWPNQRTLISLKSNLETNLGEYKQRVIEMFLTPFIKP